MVTKVSAVEFEQNFDDLLRRVQYDKDSIIISKDGQSIAALVDVESFECIRRMMWSRFDEVAAKIAAGFANIPEEEGIAEIDRIVFEERHR